MTTLRVYLDFPPDPARELEWALFDDANRVVRRGRAPIAGWPSAESREAVIAAAHGRLVTVKLPPLPPPRVQSAASFALEEQLAGAPEDSHVATGTPIRRRLAACRHRRRGVDARVSSGVETLRHPLAACLAGKRPCAAARWRLVLVCRVTRARRLCADRQRIEHLGRTIACGRSAGGARACACRQRPSATPRSSRRRGRRSGPARARANTNRRRIYRRPSVALVRRRTGGVRHRDRPSGGRIRHRKRGAPDGRSAPVSAGVVDRRRRVGDPCARGCRRVAFTAVATARAGPGDVGAGAGCSGRLSGQQCGRSHARLGHRASPW